MKHANRYLGSFELENIVRRVSKFKIENTNELFMCFQIVSSYIFAVLNLKMLQIEYLNSKSKNTE